MSHALHVSACLPKHAAVYHNDLFMHCAVLARDLQQVVFYDAKGEFVGVRRPGSGKPIEVEGRLWIMDEIVGASGMQMKHDPGIFAVYTGFGFLMASTVISFISHSQVWALQEGSQLHVGGKTNRALFGFADEYDQMLNTLPEAGSSV